jgi:hypothetical protein
VAAERAACRTEGLTTLLNGLIVRPARELALDAPASGVRAHAVIAATSQGLP